MTELEKVINQISGHRGKKDYEALYYAVLSASNYKRENITMNSICTDAASYLSVKPQSISKAISRAVIDIWDYGDRSMLVALCGHSVKDKPTPKDLILILHQYTN